MTFSLTKRLVPLILAVAMVLSFSAMAAPSSPRQQDLGALYETLKTAHPNLFANTPEAAFLARKAEIAQRMEEESSFEFALDCASLAALAKDSHTSVSLGASVGSVHYWLFDMEQYEGKWLLSMAQREHAALLGCEVTAINGMSVDKIMDAYRTIISADNQVKLQRTYWQMCYVAEPYFYLGLAKEGDPLRVTVVDASGAEKTLQVAMMAAAEYQTADIVTLAQKATGKAATACDRKQAYFGKALNASTYYIQYNQCIPDPNLPMKTFAQQTEAALAAGKYSLILLDLRNNGGGSDGLISPLLEILMAQRDRGVQVGVLIGSATFSSAIINAVELQEMGFPLLGENTSGSVSHFGAVHSSKLPNSQLTVNVSSKFISMAGYFDAGAGRGVETLVPDVTICQTLADTLSGRDTCVEAILADPAILKQAERADAPLTRGRFVGQLYAAAGSPARVITDRPFDDLFGFEWFVPAVDWARAQQIAQGAGEGTFLAARNLSWQEAAVLLTRTAKVLALQPKTIHTDALPATLQTAAWNHDAVVQAWQWGLLPADGDFSGQPTRAQGSAMLTALTAAK